MSNNDSSALIGRTIAGKFVIDAVIAGGGIGTVFRARQLGLDRMVALKLLREEFARDDDFIERFKREARAASRLDHPNSVRVLDFGQHEGSLLYLAMEYVEGRTLYQVIHDDAPLSDERIVDILSQVLAAVGVAHDMQVIHRDLKPENIMIIRGKSDEGEHAELAKVLDFGIASLGTVARGAAGEVEGPRMTKRGRLVGTPEYMAPEQAGGERADRRSDLYSAGVVLYQMLAGRLPFNDESPLTLAVKHITEPPPSPSLFAAVNPRLEAVCMRALSKRPDERFATAREMRAALRAAINLAPGRSSSPQSVFSGSDRHSGTFIGALINGHRRRAPLLVALASAMVLAGVVGVRFLFRPRPVPPPAVALAPPPSPAGGGESETAAGKGAGAGTGTPAAEGDPPALPAPSAAPSTAPSAETAPARRDPPSSNRRAKGTGARGGRDKGKHGVRVANASRGARAGTRGAGKGAKVAALAAASRTDKEPRAALAGTPGAKGPTPTPMLAPASRPPPNISRATVAITAVATSNAITGSSIRAALSRAPITDCYRDALRAAGEAAGGTAVLHLKIDIAGYVTASSLAGAQFLPGVKSCVEKAARIARVKDVDTGEGTADITLTFACPP